MNLQNRFLYYFFQSFFFFFSHKFDDLKFSEEVRVRKFSFKAYGFENSIEN